VLLAVGGFVVAEAIRRLVQPPAVEPGVMAVFGVIALAGNAVSVLVLSRVRDGNLNTRAAMLEVASDALGAGAVLAAAAVIALTGWMRADPVASLLIGVLMEATPKGVDLAAVRAHILAVDHVQACTTCMPPPWPPTCRSSPHTWWWMTPAFTTGTCRACSTSCSSAWPGTSTWSTAPSSSSRPVTPPTNTPRTPEPGGRHGRASARQPARSGCHHWPGRLGRPGPGGPGQA
jgi:hypothetical protein